MLFLPPVCQAKTKTDLQTICLAGSAPDVALHVRSNFRSLPEPNWSTEKVNALYYNKLIVVLHDLKCSGLAGLPPDSSEKKALMQLLDYLTLGSVHVKGN